jgi:hypothetical protein
MHRVKHISQGWLEETVDFTRMRTSGEENPLGLSTLRLFQRVLQLSELAPDRLRIYNLFHIQEYEVTRPRGSDLILTPLIPKYSPLFLGSRRAHIVQTGVLQLRRSYR